MSTGHLRIAGGLCAAALAFGAAACGSGGSTAAARAPPPPARRPPSGKPLVIGISLSLTGDFADPGKAAKKRLRAVGRRGQRARAASSAARSQLKIVDDTSSPNQVVTNYQNLINRDKVDLVFGPFSTPAHRPGRRRSPTATATRSSSRPAAARRCSRRTSTTSSSSQPAPVVELRRRRSPTSSSRCPPAERPKTAAYPSSTTRSPRRSPSASAQQFEAAGIKTVYKTVYPAETPDLTPIMAKVAAAKPDMRRRRHAERRRLRAGQGHGPAEVQPEVPVHVQRRELAGGVPGQGRRAATSTASCRAGDWFPDSKRAGQRRLHRRLHQEVRRHRGHDRLDIGRGLRRRPGARGGRGQDRQGRQRDDHQDAAPGHLADASRATSAGTPTAARRAASAWSSGRAASSCPVFPPASAQHAPAIPKPTWSG